MPLKKLLLLFSVTLFLFSCYKFGKKPENETWTSTPKVWGYKPVYASSETSAKAIVYSAVPQAVVNAGNIYAFHNYIFQIDPGSGIHVIDNSTPSAASRIGFITVKGCTQMSIKNDKLYTNSYDDLVVLDFSNLANVHEHSRLKGVFPELRYYSPIAQPPVSGWYECPAYDKLVTGWTRDSVYQNCFKN